MNSVRKSTLDTETVSKSVNFRLRAKNSTRWNTQLHCIRSVVKAFEADPQLQSKLNAVTKHGKLTPMEFKILKELMLLLEPFEEATDEFQADYETLGSVIPAYLDMLVKVTLSVKDSTGMDVPNPESPLAGKIHHCKEVANALRASLEKRMSYVLTDANFVLGNATRLRPFGLIFQLSYFSNF